MRLLFNIANIIFILLTMAGCQSTDKQSAATKDLERESTVNIDEIVYVTFDYDSSFYWIFPPNSVNLELTKADMIACEKLLNVSLESYNKEQQIRIDTIRSKYPTQEFRDKDFLIFKSEYGRQYIAATTPTGDIFVHINFFCEPDNYDYWNEQYLSVDDGGNCYFQVLINLNTNEILDFSVNGWA